MEACRRLEKVDSSNGPRIPKTMTIVLEQLFIPVQEMGTLLQMEMTLLVMLS